MRHRTTPTFCLHIDNICSEINLTEFNQCIVIASLKYCCKNRYCNKNLLENLLHTIGRIKCKGFNLEWQGSDKSTRFIKVHTFQSRSQSVRLENSLTGCVKDWTLVYLARLLFSSHFCDQFWNEKLFGGLRKLISVCRFWRLSNNAKLRGAWDLVNPRYIEY